MLCTLASPITLDDGTLVTDVFVRVPDQALWDANPIGVSQSTWNLSHIAGIPLDAISKLCRADVDAICETWRIVMERHNAASPFARGLGVRLNRSERRRAARLGLHFVSSTHLSPEA